VRRHVGKIEVSRSQALALALTADPTISTKNEHATSEYTVALAGRGVIAWTRVPMPRTQDVTRS